jgi:hypothetical protein
VKEGVILPGRKPIRFLGPQRSEGIQVNPGKLRQIRPNPTFQIRREGPDGSDEPGRWAKILKILEVGGGGEFAQAFFPNEPSFKMAFKMLMGFVLRGKMVDERSPESTQLGPILRGLGRKGTENGSFLTRPKAQRGTGKGIDHGWHG